MHVPAPEPKQTTAEQASRVVSEALEERVRPTDEEAQVAVQALDLAPVGHICTSCGALGRELAPQHRGADDDVLCAGPAVPVYRAQGLER